MGLLDNSVEEASNDMTRLERLVIVAIWCNQENPSSRPSMKKITQMLEGVIEVFVPQHQVHCIFPLHLQKVVSLSFHCSQLKGEHLR